MKSNLFIIFVAAYLLTSNAEAISERSYKEPGDLLYSLDDGNKLIKMAEKKFGKLTEADKILFAAVADGHQANYSEGADKDKPEDANSWPEKRTINANRIEWLCRDKQAKELVADKGIWVTGAKIEGTVDLSFAEVPFPLAFWESAFTEKIDIEHSKIKFLAMDGSRTGSILADGMKVDDSVFLREGFRAEGEAAFRKVEIGGDFDCHNGEFINKGKEAISADGISVKGSILLNNGFKANGEVRFPGATIGGDFDCNNGEFNNVDGRAIFADGMDIKGSVFLKNGFKANGEVHFLGAAIGGNFECINGKFINKGGRAILADGMNVKGAVFLRDGFKSNGEVRFPGAAIGGNFDCSDGNFINENGYAISADGMAVKGSVFLNNGFKANGEFHFLGAVIGGDFDCSDGNFINEHGYTILADRMDVKGSVFLNNGFKTEGGVRFLGAGIGSNLDCSDGNFINENGYAISADGMNVKGSVFLNNGFKTNGEIHFLGAVIGGDFDCSDGNFINENGYAISADGIAVKGSVFLNNGFKVEGKVSLVGATFGGHFTWREVNLTGKTILDLRNAKTGVLWDDEKSWPAKGNLFLDGFVYENIGDNAPKDAKSRIEWLNRQGDERFRPGPYEQLAKVLEKMGHNEDAIKIRIEKEEKITKHGGFGWLGKFRRDVFWFFLGYGYQLWRSWLCVGVFIVFGSFVFWKGRKADIIVPMEKDAYVPGKGRQLRERYPKFGILDALIYSFEMFVPVLDLRLAKYWIPDANKRWGPVLRWYMWLHIIAGWTLTTFLIVGLTGLIKK
jgi:sRNA-binding regulator protein Hfq